MAKGWRRAAELLLSRSGIAGFAEGRRSPSVMILAYHNIVPTGEEPAGDVSLHIDQATFADHLDWLMERRAIVSLAEAMELVGGADSDLNADSDLGAGPPSEGAPRVVITFDDAYRGTMTAGMEELAKRGLPSTVFVPPGLLGAEGFWWDLLAPPGGRPLDAPLREHALRTLAGRTSDVMAWAADEGLPRQALPSHALPVTEEELSELGAGPGVTLGAHTWSHPNLARLAGQELDDELRRSRDWLRQRFDAYVDLLAYPYGLVGPEAEAAAARVFDGALLVDGGAAVVRGSPTGTPYRIPRVNVPRGLSLDGLALRLAGIR